MQINFAVLFVLLAGIQELREIVGIENSNRLISIAAKQCRSEQKEVFRQCFIEVFGPQSNSKEKGFLLQRLISRVRSSCKEYISVYNFKR